jgi:sirohydrochlorin cobaltochelatase
VAPIGSLVSAKTLKSNSSIADLRCPVPKPDDVTVVLMVFHGSHDAQYQAAVPQFLADLRQGWDQLDVGRQYQFAETFLDCAPEPLHQQIQGYGAKTGAQAMQLVPMFLAPGVHVMEDIPAEVALAQAQLAGIELDVLPHLGSWPELGLGLGRSFTADEAVGRIVMAHGSRRAGGNQPIESLAASLGGLAAYWSVAPSLDSAVKTLYDRGMRQIEVLPYFLFAGSLTTGIAQQREALIQKWPDVSIKLLPTLAQQSSLTRLMLDRLSVANPRVQQPC